MFSVFPFANTPFGIGLQGETPPPPLLPSITDIDGDNSIRAGQLNVQVNGQNLETAIDLVLSSGQALPIISATETQIITSIPFPTDLKWDTVTTVTVTTPEGSATISGVSLLPAVGWEYQDYDGTVLSPTNTESFQELALSEFGIVLQANDRFNWQSRPDLSFRPDGTPIVDPPQSLTFDGFFWVESLQANTALISVTINDLGPPPVEVPTLSNPSGFSSGDSTGFGSVRTDLPSGLMYGWATLNPTEIAADILANGQVKDVTSNTVSFTFFNITNGQTYYNHFVQVAGVEQSNVVSSQGYIPQPSGSGAGGMISDMVTNMVEV